MSTRIAAAWTKDDFVQWLIDCQYDQSQAARELGRSREQIRAYKDGVADVPRVVMLACMELRRRRRRAMRVIDPKSADASPDGRH